MSHFTILAPFAFLYIQVSPEKHHPTANCMGFGIQQPLIKTHFIIQYLLM